MTQMNQETYAVVRTEKKYEISEEQCSRIRKMLSKVMQADLHSGPQGYLVRSLYFDSIYDDDLFDKINGLEFRKKVRLRIYSFTQDNVKLELKQKQGSAQIKKTLKISRKSAEMLIRGDFSPLLNMSDEFARHLYSTLMCGVYRPKCIIEYKRAAFTVHVNNVRVTIDSDIRASCDCSRFWDSNAALLPLMKSTVLEVKYDGFLPEHCRDAVNLAGIPEMSFSKYEMARQAIF